jgi:hypothetical protein
MASIQAVVDLGYPDEGNIMSEDDPDNPSAEDVYAATGAPSDAVSSAVRGTADHIAAAIDTGRKPGMPLSVLSNMVREAPLGSPFCGFLVGSGFCTTEIDILGRPFASYTESIQWSKTV